MNADKIRTALNTIAVGLGELSEALTDTPAAAASQGRESATAVPPAVSPAPQPSLADESVDFAVRAGDDVLGSCPVHFKPWSVREGGISRSGKPYSAFWKCDSKNPDGSFCSKKPDKGWVSRHDPEKAAAAQSAY